MIKMFSDGERVAESSNDMNLAMQRAEVFDGTKTFPMEADDSFFREGSKQKVKMSARRKRREQHPHPPTHWLTVDNDYTEL
ncbi:hypothetical protein ACOMHN_043660 [Nucella lapillus]